MADYVLPVKVFGIGSTASNRYMLGHILGKHFDNDCSISAFDFEKAENQTSEAIRSRAAHDY